MAATVWNSADKNAAITLSGSDLTAEQTSGGGAHHIARATNALSTGRYYVEFDTVLFTGAVSHGLGLSNSTQGIANNDFLGQAGSNSVGWYPVETRYYFNGAATSASGFMVGATTGDKIGFLVDLDNHVCYVWNITAGTKSALPMDLNGISGSLMLGIDTFNTGAKVTANFGASGFTGTVPSAEFASGWDGTPPTPPSCRFSAARTHHHFTISGTLSQTVQHGNSDLWFRAQATRHENTGKFYCEFLVEGSGNSSDDWGFGVSSPHGNLATFVGDVDNCSIGYFPTTGNIYRVATNQLNVGTATVGDNIGMATDFDNKKIWFRKNGGNWNNDVIGNQNPASNTGGVSISAIMSPSGRKFAPSISLLDQTAKATAKFGQSGFTYSAPSGFDPWAPLEGSGFSYGFII